MILKEYKIPYPNNNYINSIYYFECFNPNHSFFLPDGHLELMVSDSAISVSSKSRQIISPSKILFWGQLRFSGNVNAVSSYKICGVKFQPWTLNFLSKNRSVNLVDSIIDGTTLFSNKFIDNVKLLASIDWSCNLQRELASKKIIQLFLTEYSGNWMVKNNFKNTVFSIKDKNGIQSLAEILPYYRQSVRTLGNDFMKYIGISPKEYQTIVRIRKSSLDIKKGKNILHTALDLGYFDNAHFTNEFKKLSGISPKQFSTQKNLVLCEV